MIFSYTPIQQMAISSEIKGVYECMSLIQVTGEKCISAINKYILYHRKAKTSKGGCMSLIHSYSR